MRRHGPRPCLESRLEPGERRPGLPGGPDRLCRKPRPSRPGRLPRARHGRRRALCLPLLMALPQIPEQASLPRRACRPQGGSRRRPCGPSPRLRPRGHGLPHPGLCQRKDAAPWRRHPPRCALASALAPQHSPLRAGAPAGRPRVRPCRRQRLRLVAGRPGRGAAAPAPRHGASLSCRLRRLQAEFRRTHGLRQGKHAEPGAGSPAGLTALRSPALRLRARRRRRCLPA